MISVITISREYGSGGGSLARILAEQLQWSLVDAALVQKIAEKAQVHPSVAEQFDERVDPWFHRLNKALWLGGFEGMASRVEGKEFDADAMTALCRRVIEESASFGSCVIVGRGGQCILQKRPDVFHVSLYAPLPERIKRLKERFPPGTNVAALAEETDRRRAAYIRRYHEAVWTDRHLYDLMICTTIGLPTTASVILMAAGLDKKSW
jgi:cytidylate kinase